MSRSKYLLEGRKGAGRDIRKIMAINAEQS